MYKGSIYMVFEYMDHDLTGLSDRPGLRFTIPQIKVITSNFFIIINKVNYYSIHDFFHFKKAKKK